MPRVVNRHSEKTLKYQTGYLDKTHPTTQELIHLFFCEMWLNLWPFILFLFHLVSILLSKNHKIKINWIKAHAGHRENEICDKIARNEASKRK